MPTAVLVFWGYNFCCRKVYYGWYETMKTVRKTISIRFFKEWHVLWKICEARTKSRLSVLIRTSWGSSVTTGEGRVCETGERRKREGGMVPRSFSSPPLINLVQFLLLRENPGLNNLERKEPHASYRGSRLFERMNYCARFSPYSHKETCQNVCRICVKKGCSKWDSMLPGLLFKRSSDPFTNPATSPA